MFQDTRNGYFMNVNKQVQTVCSQVAADPMLADGYNAIGFSQGAQFLYVCHYIVFVWLVLFTLSCRIKGYTID